MTNDLRKRLSLHNSGKVASSKRRKLCEPSYYAAHYSKSEAATCEHCLKTGWRKNWIKRALANFLGFTGKLGGRAGVVQQ